MAKVLTDKQARFVALWNGNATETAEMCGYSNPRQAGQRLMHNVVICSQIQERRASELKPLIATRHDRQKFWTQTMSDPEGDMKDRLKASELLGRSEGDFLDRVALGGDEKNSDPIKLILETINGGSKGVPGV